jgi:hypothetical protein
LRFGSTVSEVRGHAGIDRGDRAGIRVHPVVLTAIAAEEELEAVGGAVPIIVGLQPGARAATDGPRDDRSSLRTGLAAAPHRHENGGRRMSRLSELHLPIRAATETAAAHGMAADRCDILQDGHTLVLRLSESLVARVVTDRDGPRQGGEWFARESAVACHCSTPSPRRAGRRSSGAGWNGLRPRRSEIGESRSARARRHGTDSGWRRGG